jgi:hypothetical protein
MNEKKLTYDQLVIAEKVIAAAEKNGINPDFVLPMVMGESGFNQKAKSSAGALGVMQLMPATAKSLGVDPTDVDQNIDGGMRLLKELMSNKKIGNDPYKIIAGYNANPTTKFISTGNVEDLPYETVAHLDNVMRYYGGDLPSPAFSTKEETATAESEPVFNESAFDGLEPGPVQESRSSPVMAGVASAGLGATAGAFGAGKKVLFDVGSALLNRDKAGASGALSNAKKTGTSGERWAAKTGYGVGEGTVRDVSQKYQKMIPKGKVARAYAEKLGGTQAMKNAQAALMAEQRLIETAQAAENSPLRQAGRYVGQVAGMPFKGALAGFGAGFGAQDAMNRYREGDVPGAVAAGAGAAASALAPFVPFAGPLSVAIPLGLYARDQMTEMTPEESRAYKKQMGNLGGLFNQEYDPNFNP